MFILQYIMGLEKCKSKQLTSIDLLLANTLVYLLSDPPNSFICVRSNIKNATIGQSVTVLEEKQRSDRTQT